VYRTYKTPDLAIFNNASTRFQRASTTTVQRSSGSTQRQSSPINLSSDSHLSSPSLPSSYLLCTFDNATRSRAQAHIAGIEDVGSVEARNLPFAHSEKVEKMALFIRVQSGGLLQP